MTMPIAELRRSNDHGVRGHGYLRTTERYLHTLPDAAFA
jgi:hypothetical protein